MTLTDILASHRETTVRTLADTITSTPDTHPEFLQNLERIWQKELTDHTEDDRVWLDAAATFTPEFRKTLRDDAYGNGLYAAARCLTYLSA